MNSEFINDELNKIEPLGENLEHETSEDTSDVNMLMTGGQAGAVAYGIHRVSEIPEVKEKIQDCKDGFSEIVENVKDTISDFGEKIQNGIKEYCCGVYENINDFFGHKDKENLSASQFPETAKFNEGIIEGREFGLDECTEAAKEIFTPEVINDWGSMSMSERKEIAYKYASEVADAFDLEMYNGVIIEDLGPTTLGSNNGDGYIHISDSLIGAYTTPFQIMDTITHELRHQYQRECINGFHNVPDEVRNEWSMALAIYNYDQPSCFDPWGYSYNPLEIDSNYAGNTVVRNVTSDMFNNLMA